MKPNKGKIVGKVVPFLVMQDMDYQFFTESVESEMKFGSADNDLEKIKFDLSNMMEDAVEFDIDEPKIETLKIENEKALEGLRLELTKFLEIRPSLRYLLTSSRSSSLSLVLA